MNISTSSPTNVTVADVLPVSHSSHMRNQVLGGVGTLTNLVAVIMLWLSTRIRPSLKQALVSMALGDLLIMVVAAVWRPGLPCWPAMYSISSSILITYFSAVLLAFHNYVAVFYPMRCKQILSLGRSLVAVLSCWLGGLLISLACLGVHIPEGSRCYVIAIMPRSGIIAESLICLLCSCFIIATNLRVLLDIRRRSRQRGHTVVCRAANNTASQPVTSAISSCSAVYFNTMTSVIVKPNPNNLVTPISDTVTPSPRLIEWRLKGRSVEKPSSSNGCRHIPSDPPNGKTHNENINTQTCINSKRVYSVPQKVSDLQQEANFVGNTDRTVDYRNLQHQRFPQNDLDNVPGPCSRRANFCGTSKDVNGSRDSCATQLEESGNSAQVNTIYSQITREQSFLEQIKCSADVYQIDDDSYHKPNATVQSKSARTIGESKGTHLIKNGSTGLIQRSRLPVTLPASGHTTDRRTQSSETNEFSNSQIEYTIIDSTDFIEPPSLEENPQLEYTSPSSSNSYSKLQYAWGDELHVHGSDFKRTDTGVFLGSNGSCSGYIQNKSPVDVGVYSVSKQILNTSIQKDTHSSIQNGIDIKHRIKTRPSYNKKKDQFAKTMTGNNCYDSIAQNKHKATKNIHANDLGNCTESTDEEVAIHLSAYKHSDKSPDKRCDKQYCTEAVKGNEEVKICATSDQMQSSTSVDRVSSISGDMLSSSTASVFASNGAAVVFTPARDVSISQIRSSLDCHDQGRSSHGKGIPATSGVYPIGENRSLSHNEVSSDRITTRLAPCAGADHPNGDVPPASLLQTCPNPNSTGAVYIRSTSETNSQRKSWRRRTQYTLVILCSWCCFLSLPYVVYGGYVAIWIDDRTSFISSGLGLLVSSLAGISSITNPILYAWRFVEWGDIRKKCCRKFRRFQVQH